MTDKEFVGTVLMMLAIGAAGWALGWMWIPLMLAGFVGFVFLIIVAALVFRAWVNWYIGPNNDVLWGRKN